MDQLWRTIAACTSSYRREVSELPVAPFPQPEELRRAIAGFGFENERAPIDVIGWVDHHMRAGQLHTSHPRYFGLFNPAPLPMGIIADALVAAWNPQLAAWSHSPFAVELERHLIQVFGEKFGYASDAIDGTFCSGGAEANHTAVLCAIVSRFSEFGDVDCVPSTRNQSSS